MKAQNQTEPTRASDLAVGWLAGQHLMLLNGDCRSVLKELEPESVQCVVTSPPYWGLRDYKIAGQIGLEVTPEEYVSELVEVFRKVRRVLKSDGTLWLNLGDSYFGSWGNYCGENRGKQGQREILNGSRVPNPAYDGLEQWRPPTSYQHATLKPKDLCMMPARVALGLQADGWWVRQDIIWAKPNPMPESVTDRCTKSHEYIFLLTKSQQYFYNHEAIKEESITNDIRRPYGSKGAWDMDGLPDEQKHGGEPRSFKGSKFHTGKTAEHQLHRSSKSPRVNGNLPGRDDNGHACNGPGQEYRNKRSVWTVGTQPYSEAHFATFPPDLIKPCVLAGTKPGDVILDPFGGSGTTGMVAIELGRKAILIELNAEYAKLCEQRCAITPGFPLAC